MSGQQDFSSISWEFALVGDPRQIDVKDPRYLEIVESLRGACREVCDRLGYKVVASALGIPRATLSHALAGRSGHHLYMAHFPWLIANDASGGILDVLRSIGEPPASDAELARAHESAVRRFLSSEQRPAYQRCLRAAVLDGRRAKLRGEG